MDNLDPFEDIKREYVNRYSETGGVLLADNYDSFVAKVLSAIQLSLNDPYSEGWMMMRDLARSAQDRGLSPEQWQQQKVDILKILFFSIISECPQLKHEMAVHLYNELRRNPT